MATTRQIQANKRNAQHSTGPRSAEGKTASSRNALKTGIYATGTVIGYESISELSELEAKFTAQYQPVNPDERSLVDMLIHSEWMLRRYRWVETEVWTAARQKLSDQEIRTNSGGFSFINEPAISRIHRLRNATQRQFRETLDQLRELQSDRIDREADDAPVDRPPDPSLDSPPPPEPAQAEPQPPREPDESTGTSPQIGFVPSNPVTRPAASQPPVEIVSPAISDLPVSSSPPRPLSQEPTPKPQQLSNSSPRSDLRDSASPRPIFPQRLPPQATGLDSELRLLHRL